MTNYYHIPIGTIGSFEFLPPFGDNPDINKKEFEVVEVRKIKVLHDAGLDPLNNIYLAGGLTKEDFINDLDNEVPIYTLAMNEDEYLYIPATKIKSMPPIIGHTATERIISLSLGLLPDDIDISNLLASIKEVVNDTLSIQPEIIEQPGGPTILMPKSEYNKIVTMLSSQERSKNKSWRVLYKEEVERNRVLKIELEQINRILAKFLSLN